MITEAIHAGTEAYKRRPEDGTAVRTTEELDTTTTAATEEIVACKRRGQEEGRRQKENDGGEAIVATEAHASAPVTPPQAARGSKQISRVSNSFGTD